jgi:hypothetical protein
VHCSLCGRSVGVVNSESGFNPISQHRSFCPWIFESAIKSTMTDASTPAGTVPINLAGWKQVRVLSNIQWSYWLRRGAEYQRCMLSSLSCSVPSVVCSLIVNWTRGFAPKTKIGSSFGSVIFHSDFLIIIGGVLVVVLLKCGVFGVSGLCSTFRWAISCCNVCCPIDTGWYRVSSPRTKCTKRSDQCWTVPSAAIDTTV